MRRRRRTICQTWNPSWVCCFVSSVWCRCNGQIRERANLPALLILQPSGDGRASVAKLIYRCGAFVRTDGCSVPLTYNIKDAAERLGVSRRWLREFLREHPADKAGIPFYVPIGNRKRLTERDLERILEENRETERELLSPRTTVYPVLAARHETSEGALNEDPAPTNRFARALVRLKERV